MRGYQSHGRGKQSHEHCWQASKSWKQVDRISVNRISERPDKCKDFTGCVKRKRWWGQFGGNGRKSTLGRSIQFNRANIWYHSGKSVKRKRVSHSTIFLLVFSSRLISTFDILSLAMFSYFELNEILPGGKSKSIDVGDGALLTKSALHYSPKTVTRQPTHWGNFHFLKFYESESHQPLHSLLMELALSRGESESHRIPGSGGWWLGVGVVQAKSLGLNMNGYSMFFGA